MKQARHAPGSVKVHLRFGQLALADVSAPQHESSADVALYTLPNAKDATTNDFLAMPALAKLRPPHICDPPRPLLMICDATPKQKCALQCDDECPSDEALDEMIESCCENPFGQLLSLSNAREFPTVR